MQRAAVEHKRSGNLDRNVAVPHEYGTVHSDEHVAPTFARPHKPPAWAQLDVVEER